MAHVSPIIHGQNEVSCYYPLSKNRSNDESSIGNAKVAGMADDLELDSGKYSITLVVFFIGYVLCEIPSK